MNEPAPMREKRPGILMETPAKALMDQDVELRQRRKNSFYWAVVIAMALGWHLAWGAVIRPVTPKTTTDYYAAPQVQWWLAESNRPVGAPLDVRMVWSPVLFSLPAPAGFSRQALTNVLSARPPLSLPDYEPPLVQRPVVPATNPVIQENPSWVQAIQDELDSFPLKIAEAPVALAPSSLETGIEITLTDDLAGRKWKENGLPRDLQQPPENSWDASISVEVDEGGRIIHAFLEDVTCPDDLAALLVRTVLTWRLDPGIGPARGRIVFHAQAPQKTVKTP